MENKILKVEFDEKNGGMASLAIKADEAEMNWIKPGRGFGVPIAAYNARYFGKDFALVSFEEGESEAVASYATGNEKWGTATGDFTAKTRYSFDSNGNLEVETTVTNDSPYDMFFSGGDLGFNFNFYDDYFDANTCMTSRCNTHLFCGEEGSYVCALKMGESEYNVGLVVTEGGLRSYSQEGVKSNDRGYFVVNAALTHLRPGEAFTLKYVIFTHTGKDDFAKKAAAIGGCFVRSDNFTYFEGETVALDVYSDRNVTASGADGITVQKRAGCARITFEARGLGEKKIDICYGGKRTYAKIFVSSPVEEIVRRRLDYVIDRQQWREEGSRLDGAFLIYDTEEEHCFYDERFSDYNGQRERLGMTMLLAYYLQTHKNARYRDALERALAFVYREVFDEESGEVFNFAGKYSTWLRLYNFPWVALLLVECHKVTKEIKLLRDAAKIMKAYYARGGSGFYPNGIFVRDMILAIEENGLTSDAAELKTNFLGHVENIVKRGTNYPKHEVNYEQTIVTPAVSFVLDAYLLTGDGGYLAAVQPHVAALERFDGVQPHYMLNEIAIRYWDDFWFGKIHEFGDTLPHYWSSLSSIDYIKYGKAAGDEERLKRGRCGLRNCLCLFMRDGSASCARLFPFKVNGTRGERFDPFCNDQDFALYFAYKYL